MIYIESENRDPYFNLALEEYVFEKMDRTEQYFILWQNENTIVVGNNQNTIEEIDQDFVCRNNIKVVRRLSGGGAVYHDSGNLNYTFIVDKDDIEDFNFRVFSQSVINVLDKFNIKAEFSGRNDLLIDGKKFCGTAQYVKNNRIMHHGCIMVNSNTMNVSGALKPSTIKYQSKSTKSVRSRITTIDANSDVTITVPDFKKAFKEEIFGNTDVLSYEFTKADLSCIRQLSADKYETWDWNYGNIPECNFRNAVKFDFGLVEVNALIQNGLISNIKITGDFFGNSDISQLEKKLTGWKVDRNLLGILNDIDVGSYISGASPYDLFKLIVC